MTWISNAIDYINQQFCKESPLKSIQAFGVADEILDEGRRYYGAEMNGRFEQILPDDRFDLVMFHIIEDRIFDDNTNAGFGLEIETKSRINVATYIFGNRSRYCDILQNQLADFLFASLPSVFPSDFLSDNGLIYAGITNSSVRTDKRRITDQILTGVNMDRFQTDLDVVEIRFTIHAKSCTTKIC